VSALLKSLILPLTEKLLKWLASRLTLIWKQVKHKKKIDQETNRALNEQDQRGLEDIIGKGGGPSGRGVIVDSLPGVRESKGNKGSNLAE
jgi:hypothetical protein